MKEKSQFTNKSSDAKDKDERLSNDKYQTTTGSVCTQLETTAFLASISVPFWKDQKIWIQIAIVGIHLAICVYTGFSSKTDNTDLTGSHHQSDKALESSHVGCNSVATEKLHLNDDSNIASKEDVKDLINKDWEKRQQTLGEHLHRKIEESLREIQSQLNGIKEQIKTHKEDIDKAKSVLETQNKSMVQSLENLQNQMEHMENNMTKMMEKVKEVETQIKTVENDATKTIEKVQKVEIQMKTLESGMTKTNERVEGVDDQLNVFYEELKENSIYIVGCFLAIVICIIVGGHTLLASRSNPKNKITGLVHGTGAHRSMHNSAIIENLRRKGLKNGMSIIYFDSSAKDFYHMVLMEVQVFESLKMDDFCLIQSFNDLKDVEPHKFVFIFVEFNDRNIILENENLEIGDLRNQTTKVLISLGCDVFVVYCKDKGSRDLPPNSLYNTRLTSIEKHPVLFALSKKKRVMSINDRFHSYQVEHLKENAR
uniref:Uncharacterized protein LOC111123533 isoform X2 n=1 Tax=Crassostrea virginica TaxID=6565 RepID=A0A8B8D0G1_CRAVI|nr:uncharacterized protein LOC111123533 isoform X2 [Crassostrea virginica]